MEQKRKNAVLNVFWAPWWMAVPMVALFIVFAVFPEIDMKVSGSVYNAATGGFYLGHPHWMDYADYITSFGSTVALAAVVVWWLIGKGLPVRGKVPGRVVAYLLLAFLIGPVLTISLGFKEHWGRNRPVEVTEFGGAAPFTPYWNTTGKCESDCSFPSGHSSRGFIFMAAAIAAFGLGWRYRYAMLAAALAIGVSAATFRIMEGKHFLSDVTLSACIVIYLSWVLFRFMYPESRLPQPR